jgi:hypothetical protein
MFGRRSTSTGTQAEATSSEGPKPQGKGRPTPKRRDAEAARKAKTHAPKDKKQAKATLRAEQKREREAQLAAMRAGDERLYPLRDRGRARRIARNYVDGRRGAGEFFWPIVIVSLIGLLMPVRPVQATATWVLLGYYLLILTDTTILLTGLNRLLKREVPDDSTRKGTLPYAFGRSLQSRKRRMPVVKVSVGWSRQAMRGDTDPLKP